MHKHFATIIESICFYLLNENFAKDKNKEYL